jgi:hypothetical protein
MRFPEESRSTRLTAKASGCTEQDQKMTDISHDLLMQLQAAWVPPPAATTTETKSFPEETPVLTARCLAHVPPFALIEIPDRTRPGYLRGTCNHCGRFIGYRFVSLEENNTPKRPRKRKSE